MEAKIVATPLQMKTEIPHRFFGNDKDCRIFLNYGDYHVNIHGVYHMNYGVYHINYGVYYINYGVYHIKYGVYYINYGFYHIKYGVYYINYGVYHITMEFII